MECPAARRAITEEVDHNPPRITPLERHTNADRDDKPTAQGPALAEDTARDIDNMHHPTLAAAGGTLFTGDVGQDSCKAHTPRYHVGHATVPIQDVVVLAQGGDGGGLTDLL